MQLILTREAYRQALATLTGHALALAHELSAGRIADRGGPEALQLFVAVIEETQRDCEVPLASA